MAGGSMIRDQNLEEMRNNQRKYQMSQDKYGMGSNHNHLENSSFNPNPLGQMHNVNTINPLSSQPRQGGLSTIVTDHPNNKTLSGASGA